LAFLTVIHADQKAQKDKLARPTYFINFLIAIASTPLSFSILDF
jgi:hypothetical protein